MPDVHELEKPKSETNSGIHGRILKGVGAQGFSQLVYIFIRLAEVPLFLSFWGPQLYGEWLMLSAIPSYFAISDGGFATAACREMTMLGGANDRRGALAVFQSTWLLLIVVSLVVFAITIGLVGMFPLSDSLGFSIIDRRECNLVLLLLVAHVLVGFQGGLINGGFWVSGRYPTGMYFLSIMQLMEFGALAIAVVLGGGPVQAATGYLTGRVIGTALMWWGQIQVSPWIDHGFAYASFAKLKRLTAPAFASLAFPLGNALNIQGILLIVGLVLGPAAVALFVPLRTLSRLVMQPGGIINRLIEPELALAFGADNDKLFRSIFTRSCQLALWGSTGLGLAMIPAGHWFFPIWTGSVVTIHWPTYLVLILVVLVNAIWYTPLMVPYATNRHGRIAVYYVFFYGGVAFCIAFIGTVVLGLFGVAIALLVSETIMSAATMKTSLRMVKMSSSQWFKKILRPPFDLFSGQRIIPRNK